MKLSNLRLFYISSILRAPIFWFAVLVDFLQKMGLTESVIFNIIAWYSIVVVLSELPTGLIGDKYSHKVSVLLGSLITGISIFLLAFRLPMIVYYIILTGAGIGISLISGSDVALLHGISDSFDNDYKTNKTLTLTTQLIGITSGGFLYVINNRLPIILTAAFFLLSFIVTFFIKSETNSKYQTRESKMWAELKSIKKQIFSSQNLINVFLTLTIVSGFYHSFKWFFNPLFELWNLPLAWYGLLAGTTFLFKVFGVWLSKKKNIDPKILILLSIIFVGSTPLLSRSTLALLTMYLSFTTWGYIEAEMTVRMNKLISNRNRAAINSLNSLVTSLISSVILVFSGFVSNYTAVQSNIIITLAVILILVVGGNFFLEVSEDLINNKLNKV